MSRNSKAPIPITEFSPARVATPFSHYLHCSICGEEGYWPYIPYTSLDEKISSRPTDVAAILVKGKASPRESLDFRGLLVQLAQYEIFCPRCFRTSKNAEENGADKAFDLPIFDVLEILNTVYRPKNRDDVTNMMHLSKLFRKVLEEKSFGAPPATRMSDSVIHSVSFSAPCTAHANDQNLYTITAKIRINEEDTVDYEHPHELDLQAEIYDPYNVLATKRNAYFYDPRIHPENRVEVALWAFELYNCLANKLLEHNANLEGYMVGEARP